MHEQAFVHKLNREDDTSWNNSSLYKFLVKRLCIRVVDKLNSEIEYQLQRYFTAQTSS